MSTTLSTPGSTTSDMGAKVSDRQNNRKYPAVRRVTVTRAFQEEMGLSSEPLAHKRIYQSPSVEEQAIALVRSYVRAGAAAEAEQFLHVIQQAAKPDSPRPYGTEVMTQLAEVEAKQLVARQTLAMVRCRSTATTWLRHAYREVAEILGTAESVKREFSL